MGRRQSFLDLSYGIVIGGIAILALLIIVSPVVVALMTSFTEGRSLKFPPTGFSFGWYEQLFDPVKSRPIHRAAGNSLEVAAMSTLIGVVLATLAALVYFSTLGFRPSLNLMIAGHLIVTMPFILRTTTASLSQLDPALLDSSQSLGASWFYTLRRVTLPLIFPGIAAGAFLAFMASIDNVPVSLFLSNARTDTLPIRMWGMMESTLDVRVAAVSGVLIAAAFVLMLIMEWTVGLTRRMRD